jgi:hypothetical protein
MTRWRASLRKQRSFSNGASAKQDSPQPLNHIKSFARPYLIAITRYWVSSNPQGLAFIMTAQAS